MNKSLSFFCALFCLVTVFSSCEKEGGSSFIEGSYLLQTEELRFKITTTDDTHEGYYLLDIPNRKITSRLDGEDFSETFTDDKMWTNYLKSYYNDDIAGFPLGMKFNMDGTVLVMLPDDWYTDIEYWDFWFDKEDLDNWEVPVNYKIKGNLLTFSFLGINGDGAFKIVSRSGSTLKLEQTKDLIRMREEDLSDDGFKVTITHTSAVYKKRNQ